MIKNEWLWGAAFGGGWMIYRGNLDIGIKVLAVALLLLAIRNRWFSRIFRQVRQERPAMAAENSRVLQDADNILYYAGKEAEAERSLVTVSEGEWDESKWEPEAFEEMEEDEEDEEISDEEAAINEIYGSKEKALSRVNRLLLALYQRKDKLEYVNNTSPEAWARFQKTKTWRGLLWDIQNAEDTLERIERIA